MSRSLTFDKAQDIAIRMETAASNTCDLLQRASDIDNIQAPVLQKVNLIISVAGWSWSDQEACLER